VKNKVGTEEKDAYECSESRALDGSKAVKVIIIPLTLLVFVIFVAVYLVIRMNIRNNHITKMCVALLAFAWPLLFSQLWAQGVWTAFLVLWIAYAANCDGLPWWLYRLTWFLQVFQLVLLFGPTEAFHVPLFNQSSPGESQSTYLIERFLAVSETQCDTYYEGFFTRLAIEKAEVEANPDTPTYGLCTKGWLAVIDLVLVYHGIILIIMILMSADRFLEGTLSGDGSLLSKIPNKAAVAKKIPEEAGSPPPPVIPDQPQADAGKVGADTVIVVSQDPAPKIVAEVPPAPSADRITAADEAQKDGQAASADRITAAEAAADEAQKDGPAASAERITAADASTLSTKGWGTDEAQKDGAADLDVPGQVETLPA
jgi:hypothetical protein